MATAAPRPAQPRVSWFQRMETALLSGTSRTPARPSPFAFGVVTAAQFAPKAKFVPPNQIGQDIGFTIAEARDRIRGFLDGSYSPKRLGDLIDYLKGRMLRLESRRGRDGSAANYLVDMRTNIALPAAAVDTRLSRPGIARKFGNSIEAEAEAARRKAPRSPEQILAHSLRNENAGRLLAADVDAMPFQDWDDLTFSAPAMFRERDFSAQGNEIWVGVAHARASEDPAENLRIMAKARADGVQLILPVATVEDARAGRLTAGMPILIKEGAVRTRLIDPALNYQRLTEMFGKSPHEHFGDMQKRYSTRLGEQAAVRSSKVVNMQEFRQQFRRAKPAPVPAPQVAARAPAFPSGAVSNYIVRHEVSADDSESMVIVDVKTGNTYPFDVSVLGAGRFPKEDGFGLPSGYLTVSIDGGYAHFDAEGREHNTIGPAIVPAPGSGEKPRYAVEGQFVRPASFDGERNRAFIQDFSRRDYAEEQVQEDRLPVHRMR